MRESREYQRRRTPRADVIYIPTQRRPKQSPGYATRRDRPGIGGPVPDKGISLTPPFAINSRQFKVTPHCKADVNGR
ncbi:hypothetical protein JTE90_021823 [Oedothorax gibbosus]|uniref:Uncharacterized protein n=1 Tax=Oedothorax gibbosus TaxID=931172 RepID=A0AAV6V173_9ARAC|nr:hypothetical protein JTE90_021823 [Oedothorax gibbosus]